MTRQDTLFDPKAATGRTFQARDWCWRQYRHNRMMGQGPMVAAMSVWEVATHIQTSNHREAAIKEWKVFYARRNLRLIWQRALQGGRWAG